MPDILASWNFLMSAGSTWLLVRSKLSFGTVEVGRHGGDEIAAVLLAIGLAQLDAGDLGQCVGLVGGLEGSGEQLVLGDGLGCLAGVDARAAQVQQLRDTVGVRGVNHGGVDHHVVVEELGRPGGVGHDAPNRARHEHDVLGPIGPEPVVDRCLIAEIKLIAPSSQHVREALRLELAHDC